MTVDRRLSIHDQRLTVHKNSGYLLIRAPSIPGYEHILCIEGDKRILCNAFDQYVACDVFEHYVGCRDINILETATVSVSADSVIGKEIQYIYKDAPTGDPGYLQIVSNNNNTVTISVNTDSIIASAEESDEFMIGTEGNMISFTEAGTKSINVDGRIMSVNVISIESAVFTIESMLKLGFPDEGIGGLDDISGEAVFADIVPENTIQSSVKELAGEIVLEDIVDTGDPMLCVLDELASEIVFRDDNVYLGAPTDLVACLTDATLLDLLPPGDVSTDITYLSASGQKALQPPTVGDSEVGNPDEILFPSGNYPLRPPLYKTAEPGALEDITFPSGEFPLRPPIHKTAESSTLTDVVYTDLRPPIVNSVTSTFQNSSSDPSETITIL